MNINLSRLLQLSFALLVMMSSQATAHFPWLAIDDDRHPILYFGEDVTDRQYHLPESLAEYPLAHLDADGKRTALSMQPIDNDDLIGLRAEAAVPASGSIVGSQTYGLMRGSKLVYYTQQLLDTDPAKWAKTAPAGIDLAASLIPQEDGIRVAVTFKGKPLPEVDVKLYCDDGDEEGSATTDDQGAVVFTAKQLESGYNALRVGFTDKQETGKWKDEAFEGAAHYLTVAFPWQLEKQAAPAAKDQVSVSPTKMADLPEELTSFGGAIAGGKLYVYGGHTGSAHSYSTAEQSNRLWALDLEQPSEWKKLPAGPRMQGLGLVAHGDKLIRVGGFTAMNAEGEDHDLQSQSTVSQFDTATNQWTDLAPLPEPRSSLGAAILGDVVYVASGWAMGDAEENVWHQTAWKMDLSKSPATWQPIATPPFQRRAVSVSAHDGKIYVIGGMGHEGKPSTRTDIYDPKTDTWTEGPQLIGKPMTGFGNAAYSQAGQLYVTAIDGTIQRLRSDGTQWEIVGKCDPGRFFHVMLPLGDRSLILVGGANMSIGKFTDIERIDIK
ncbi:N-acetylneuraminate epimerase precursor [Rosistilla carotiformis]|uniref:N-acetylneuraminate epimerase n=1 Tax=Rosistilla carotiformis TaxID=2528017 RepID=A0A518JY90_9BACT|nr:kelch repeat-containing protein [Rosistilla carotiformis]QDV70505.1 N-acetylneuraminate epimerase precursor [Rosistilla carotiformis]